MKKIIVLCLSALLPVLLFTGCNSSLPESATARLYSYSASSEPVIKPSLELREGDRFTFTLSPLSSYLPVGSYEVRNDTLLLKTDNGKKAYVFRIRGEALIFDAENSSALPDYADIPDGAAFR